jgi:preprotein translocase subunit SecA
MLDTLFQNTTQQILAQYNTQVKKINELGKTLQPLTDEQLQVKAKELKARLAAGESETIIVNESFALVREASDRILGLRHFDVQLLGGLVLNEGKIAEMKTGEGKTIVAMLPTFFNALYGKGTHVITVNDYLAKRDSETVGQVHQFLGLTVGLIQENMTPEERKKNYACDVVYVTNNELGFDYLRDNMAYTSDELVQRSFFYGVIDEVDSILIDEARTPLIISGASDAPTEKYLQTVKIATALKREVHYKVDEKAQNVTLSDNGVSFCEQALGIIDLYNPAEPWISYLLNSIKAKELYQKNKNYIVNSDNEIIIVDEFTGRTMPGRRWSDGLHQAVEAKEGVPIQEENQTLASISYQNLFLLYEKLSGMTGTAKTEEGEFEKIYNLNVVQIPTHRVIKRKDFSDLIYKNQYIKWRAIAQECLEMYQIGRPVLIGTTTIEKSELLASLLSEYQIPYRLLNARPENVESESEVVALAGCRNAVTIATNMAGRGTDIVLGGSPTFLTKLTLLDFFSDTRQENLSLPILEFFKNQSPQTQDRLKREYSELLQQSLATLESNTDSVVQVLVQMHKQILAEKKVVVAQEGVKIRDLGGLHVIGTERHESRRIDNQLRGRSGRQGDPGSSKFFLSLEDKLLRIFGGDQILTLMQNIGFSDTAPIQSGLLNNSLETAQKKVESYYFDTRKQLFEYDQALTTQRTGVYTERKRILQQRNLRNWVMEYAERSIYDLWICIQGSQTESFLTSLIGPTQKLLGLPFAITSNIEKSELTSYLPLLKQQIQITYNLKELEMECIEPGLLRELEKSFILQQIDFAWKEHLQKIVLLRDSIRWRAYGQKDPLTEYKKEAFNYFTIMLARIRHRVVYFVLSAKVILL